MKRLLAYLAYPFFVVVVVGWFVLSSIPVISSALLVGRWLETFFIHWWARVTLKVLRVRLRIEGSHHIPVQGNLFIFTHTSNLDIPILHTAIRKTFRFGGKVELFKVPILSQVMTTTGVLPIHRSDRLRVLKLYEKSYERIHNGESFALAPEGTRQDGSKLGAFKSGPFIFAIGAKCLVVPVVIYGAHKVWPRSSGLFKPFDFWKSREIRVSILQGLDTKQFSLDDRPVLQQQASDAMNKEYERLGREG